MRFRKVNENQHGAGVDRKRMSIIRHPRKRAKINHPLWGICCVCPVSVYGLDFWREDDLAVLLATYLW